MIIDKTKKLEKAIDKKNYENMGCVKFQDGKLLATNGIILAVVHPDNCDDDTEGGISIDAIKEARKGNQILILNDNVSLGDGRSFPRVDPMDIDPMELVPGWRDNPEFQIGLDVKLLKDLCDAIGATKVKLKFKDSLSVVIVETKSDDFGLIMPVTI